MPLSLEPPHQSLRRRLQMNPPVPGPARAWTRRAAPVIEAPVEVVWRTIADPDQMRPWFADRVDPVVEPGAHSYTEFLDQSGPVVVETVDPPTAFVPLEPSPRR
jgi:hypothetical protein